LLKRNGSVGPHAPTAAPMLKPPLPAHHPPTSRKQPPRQTPPWLPCSKRKTRQRRRQNAPKPKRRPRSRRRQRRRRRPRRMSERRMGMLHPPLKPNRPILNQRSQRPASLPPQRRLQPKPGQPTAPGVAPQPIPRPPTPPNRSLPAALPAEQHLLAPCPRLPHLEPPTEGNLCLCQWPWCRALYVELNHRHHRHRPLQRRNRSSPRRTPRPPCPPPARRPLNQPGLQARCISRGSSQQCRCPPCGTVLGGDKSRTSLWCSSRWSSRRQSWLLQ
jgi:hypothetical protein